MQLLFQHSAEGDISGLELVPGNIVPIQSSHPIPHLGWNELKSTHPLLQSDVYFVHSYQAEMSEYVVAYADYGTKIPESFNTEIISVSSFIQKKWNVWIRDSKSSA